MNPKPNHLTESDRAGFSDAGERVPVVWPDAGEVPPELALLEVLETCSDQDAKLQAIRSAFDRIGDERAAQCLGEIFRRLPGGKAARTLAHALGVATNTAAADAAAVGESKQAFSQRVKRLRRRILKKRLPLAHR